MDGCKKNPHQVLQVPCCDQPTLFRKVEIPASVGDETTNPPEPGLYRNVLLWYEATDATYLYSSDGMPTRIDAHGDTKEIWDAIHDEENARKDADDAIWVEIESIEASSDVVDVVGTYAELQQYDTSKLKDNDIIKVLQDETRDDAITYYRWNGTTFTYVGAEGPYYTASETDTLLADKQDKLIAGSNIQIAADGKTISATDTTYSAGTGISIVNNVISNTATATLYGATGQNTNGAMTQKAVTDTLFENNDTTRIKIGSGVVNGGAASIVIGSQGAQVLTPNSVAIGNGGTTAGSSGGDGYNVAIGSYGVAAIGGQAIAIGGYGARAAAEGAITIGTNGAQASGVGSIAIGRFAQTSHTDSVALGTNAVTGRASEVSLGKNAYGSVPEVTKYIAHVTAGVNNTDAVNVAQLNAAIPSTMTGATSSAVGTSGLVPAPAAGDDAKFLKGDGTWGAVTTNALLIKEWS